MEYKFTGGKQLHIFAIDTETNTYKNKFTSADAERVFNDPDTYISLKVDGENAAVMCRKAGELEFRQRIDNPKSLDGLVNIPDGKNPAEYGGHHYYYRLIQPDLVTGKGKRKSRVGPDIYDAIAKGQELKLFPQKPEVGYFRSVELVGDKHQKNVDGYPCQHALVFHGMNEMRDFPREFDKIAEIAKTEVYEGVVLMNRDKCYKIRLDLFPDSLFKKLQKSKKGKRDRVTTVSSPYLTREGILCLVGNGVRK
jgi:hypothetical protein